MYRLSYYNFLALVNEEGKAIRAYVGGAYVNKTYPNGAYADETVAKGRIEAVTASSNC